MAMQPRRDTVDMPDISGILPDRAVTRKCANTGHVEYRLTGPSRYVMKGTADSFLGGQIRGEIGEMKIGITLVQEGVVDPAAQAWLLATEKIRVQGIHDAPERRIAPIVLPWMIGPLRAHRL